MMDSMLWGEATMTLIGKAGDEREGSRSEAVIKGHSNGRALTIVDSRGGIPELRNIDYLLSK